MSKVDRRDYKCGDCFLWMTRTCPREKADTKGRKSGPSMNDSTCSMFELHPRKKGKEEDERDFI